MRRGTDGPDSQYIPGVSHLVVIRKQGPLSRLSLL